MAQARFFDVDDRLAALSAAGDPLERLSAVVDFELFRPVLDASLARSDRSRGGVFADQKHRMKLFARAQVLPGQQPTPPSGVRDPRVTHPRELTPPAT